MSYHKTSRQAKDLMDGDCVIFTSGTRNIDHTIKLQQVDLFGELATTVGIWWEDGTYTEAFPDDYYWVAA